MLQVIGNAELRKREQEVVDKELAARQNDSVVLGLTGHLRHCWDAARQAKKPIENIMLRGLRQRNGEYEADKLRDIHEQGGSDIYMGVTEVKCRAAESWLRDILLDTGTPPWGLNPTPIPDLSPDQTMELQNAFAAVVTRIVENEGRAPNADEMVELKEMVGQEYRFKLLEAADNRAQKMTIKIADQFAQGGWADSFNEFITD